VKFTVYEDFCQLITVHLSLNGVDPLSELQRFVAMNPSEIGVKMGHTLSEYAFAFPNFIQHMHDSNPELDYSKQLELIAKKLQLFPLNSLIERMNTTIDNRIERMSKIVFITVLEFYKNSLEESTALDKIVEQCRQDLVDGSSDLFSSMHASFLKEKNSYTSQFFIDQLTLVGETDTRSQFLELFIRCILKLPDPFKYYKEGVKDLSGKQLNQSFEKISNEAMTDETYVSSLDQRQVLSAALMLCSQTPNFKDDAAVCANMIKDWFNDEDSNHDSFIQQCSTTIFDKSFPFQVAINKTDFTQSATAALSQRINESDISRIFNAVNDLRKSAGSQSASVEDRQSESNTDIQSTEEDNGRPKKRLKKTTHQNMPMLA